MKKLLVAMQYYPGDQKDAERIARLMADMEVKKRDDVEFCLAARFDAIHDANTATYLKQKFSKVHLFKSTRKEVGWPNGCNGLWHDLMCWSTMQIRQKFSEWEAVFTVESDSIPLRRDWLTRLMQEWDKAMFKGAMVVGCKIDNAERDPNYTHINGNALWDSLFAWKMKIYGTPCFHPWDVYHNKRYMPFAYDTPLMNSIHNIEKVRPVTEQILYSPRMDKIEPVFFHGAKSVRAEQIVRKKLNL